MPKFAVTVCKSVQYDIPVEAENEKQAQDLVQALFYKNDWDFVFGNESEMDFMYEATGACRCSDRRFEELSDDCEIVHPDGTHSWAE